jgi:hypothetical protein
MPGRNGQRKPGTARGSPRRSRTAKASRISRHAAKSGCAREWGGRKNPSGRCRIIYLTSESSIRYGHHDQDQRRRSNGRCRLSCPSVRDKDRPLDRFGEGGFAERLAQKVIKRFGADAALPDVLVALASCQRRANFWKPAARGSRTWPLRKTRQDSSTRVPALRDLLRPWNQPFNLRRALVRNDWETLLGIARPSALHYGTGGTRESPPDRPTIAGSASSSDVDEIRKSPNPGTPGDATLSNCMSST